MATKKKAPEIQTLPAQNREWGFYGTTLRDLGGEVGGHGGVVNDWTEDRYAAMSRRLLAMGLTAEQAREYLDARNGRHLADYYDGSHPDHKPAPEWLRADLRHFFGRNGIADGERPEQHASINFRMPGTGWTDADVARRVAQALAAVGIEVTALEVNRADR